MRKLWVLAFVLAGCADGAAIPTQELPIVHPFDAQKSQHGYDLLTVDTYGLPVVPRVGIENLWLVWPDGYSADYWPEMRKRYGLHEAPFDNKGLPMGMHDTGDGYVTFDCLLCHASTVKGQIVLGVANSTLDVQALLDDMVKGAEMVGIKPPVSLTHRTQAAGTVDAVGMGFAFGEAFYGVPEGTLHKDCGWERAPAWWQLKYKDRSFNDGSAGSPSFRTMAGTLVAFGLTEDQIAARGPMFEDIGNWILAIDSPKWDGAALDHGAWSNGRDLYDKTCAQCHGSYSDGTGFPNKIVDARDVGTDPMRVDLFRETEVDAINSTWLGNPPLQKTNGYLAPVLSGIWARAPYFHNGSVPDLMSVLDSSSRPAVWRRTGITAADWDEERVGWRYDVPADAMDNTTVEGRKIYDTARPGLSNAGHTYADALSDDDRRALLEYLKSL